MPGQTTTLHLPYPLDDDTVDVPRDVKALADAMDPLGVVPVGSVTMWVVAVAPGGWLLMQGQKVAAATYPQLAALLGQDAQQQVTIPDMRDQFPVGAGPTMALGALGGAASVGLTSAQMPPHAHGGATGSGITAGSDRSLAHPHTLHDGVHPRILLESTYGNGAPAALAATGATGWWNGDTALTGNNPTPDHLHSIPALAIAAEGGGQAHENRPPYRALNFIIRAG